MKRKNDNRKKKGERRLRQKTYVIVCLLLAVCCLFGGLLARYIHKSKTDPGQIIANKFYFTVNLLGDTHMVAQNGSTDTSYAFADESTEGTWYLYGASKHAVKVDVQNFYDSLRVTDADISYETSVEITDANGNKLSIDADKMPTVAKADNNSDQAENTADSTSGKYKLTKNENDTEVSDTLTLTIPEHTTWTYADGTIVTLKVKSTSPYEKTLTLHFVLYAVDTTLSYQVIDSVGSPYAELVLMTNVENGNSATGIQPYLKWTTELDIDNTNPLTFTKTETGTFTQMAGMENRDMQISQALATGRSESIYFFKTDTSKNYTKGQTVVNPSSNGTYIISLGTE